MNDIPFKVSWKQFVIRLCFCNDDEYSLRSNVIKCRSVPTTTYFLALQTICCTIYRYIYANKKSVGHN